MVKEEYDKGWAWAVAFAAMTINFIVAGLGRVSGIMFIAFMEAYGVDRRAASLPLSVRSSMRNFLGPVVGILGQKYGVRTIILIGGILGTVSTVICFFSTNMLWITVLYGGVGGASAAFVTILPQVVIGQYFRKYKTTAAGMGFSGGCVGSILFPAAVEQMVLSYGIGGTFLVIAAILAHIIPAAIILRDAPWARRQKKTKYKDFELQEVRYPGGGANNSVQTIGNLPSKDSVNRDSDVWPNVQFLRRNNDTVVSMLTTKYPGHAGYSLSLDTECNNSAIVMHTCLSDALEDIYCWLQQSTGRSTAYANFGFSKNNLLHERLQDARHLCSHKYHSFHLSKTDIPGVVSKTNSEPDVATLSNEISSNFVFLKLKTLLRITPSQVAEHFDEETRGEVLTILSELRKLYNMSTRLNNEGVDPPPAPSVAETTTTRQDQQSNSLCSHFVTALRLFSKPPFLLLSACRAVHLLTFVPAITTIVDFGIDQGLLEEEGKYIIAALSAGDLIGRLCLGWVTDRGFLSLPKFMLIVMIIQGVNTAGLPFLHDRPLLYSGVFSFGLWQGTLFVRHAVLVSKYCAKNEQSIAMGCSNFFGGFLGLILPMYIGYFRDTLGAYDYMYYLNGVIGASVGLFWALEPIFVRCSGSGELDENEH